MVRRLRCALIFREAGVAFGCLQGPCATRRTARVVRYRTACSEPEREAENAQKIYFNC